MDSLRSPSRDGFSRRHNNRRLIACEKRVQEIFPALVQSRFAPIDFLRWIQHSRLLFSFGRLPRYYWLRSEVAEG